MKTTYQPFGGLRSDQVEAILREIVSIATQIRTVCIDQSEQNAGLDAAASYFSAIGNSISTIGALADLASGNQLFSGFPDWILGPGVIDPVQD